MLLDTLDDDVRETTVVLRNHGEALNNGPGIYGQCSESGSVVTSEHVRVDVVNRLGDGGRCIVVGVGRWNGGPETLRRVGHLGIRRGLRVERHGVLLKSRENEEDNRSWWLQTLLSKSVQKSGYMRPDIGGKPRALLLCPSQTVLQLAANTTLDGPLEVHKADGGR